MKEIQAELSGSKEHEPETTCSWKIPSRESNMYSPNLLDNKNLNEPVFT